MNLTLIQILVDEAESSASEALSSSQSAISTSAAGTNLRNVARHTSRAAGHGSVAKKLQSVAAAVTSTDLKAVSVARSAQEAAASAHMAAASVFQLVQSGTRRGATPQDDAVKDQLAAEKSRIEAQNLSYAAVLLRGQTGSASAELQSILLTAAHANDHASAVNQMLEKEYLARVEPRPATVTARKRRSTAPKSPAVKK